MAKMKMKYKQYYIAIFVLLLLIFAIGFYFFKTAVPKEMDSHGYKIYVYPDGTGKVNFDSVNDLQQIHKDVIIDGAKYKAGTLIIPGNGDKAYYDYIRKNYYE